MGNLLKGIFEDRDRLWAIDENVGLEKRIISPVPKLSLKLFEREPQIIPKEAYNWSVRWINDIGTIMRSRSFLAFNIASLLTGTITSQIPKLLFQKSRK